MSPFDALNALIELVDADAPREAINLVMPAIRATRDRMRPTPARTCAVAACDRAVVAGGFCRPCYSRLWRADRKAGLVVGEAS